MTQTDLMSQTSDTIDCDGCGEPTQVDSLDTVHWPELGGLEPMKFRTCLPCTKRAVTNGASLTPKETS